MRVFALTAVLCLAGLTLPETARSEPVQVQLSQNDQVYIKGGDQYVSGIVSGIILTRDVTIANTDTTYWELKYNYYNGSQRWEDYQELVLDFVDKFKFFLFTMPSWSPHLRLDAVTAKGWMLR